MNHLYRVGSLAALLSMASLSHSQDMSRADIYRAPSPIVIDGNLDEAAWRQAPALNAFHFLPPVREGQPTTAKMLWDDENLYVAYFCVDRRISAYVNERHGPVSEDDCVEIFLSPNPDKVRNYYTFEINAIGAMLNRCRTDWWTGPPTWEPEGVQYRATFHGQPRKDPSPGDLSWIVEMAIPFRNFAKDAAHTPPANGDRWRLNLHRLDETDTQRERAERQRALSVWSPLPEDVHTFHSPEWFGSVRFVHREPPR